MKLSGVLESCKEHKETRGARSRNVFLGSKFCSESGKNRCFEGCVTLVLKFSRRRDVFIKSKISSGFLAGRRWSKRFCEGRDRKYS